MFRTKDLVLLLLIVAFLVIAIIYAATSNVETETQNRFAQNTPEITSVSAEVVESEKSTLSREERLAKMRELIEKSELVTISESIETESEPSPETSTSDLMTVESEPILCPAYNSFANPYWPVGEIQQQSVEGVRQYFTSTMTTVGTSSSSTVSKNVLLTLPQPFIPSGSNNCLSSSVIGAALDGSLIRNNEVGLYSLFNNQTLIGYALDGFPIYGVGSKATDSCGGRIELGQYRYELSSERPTIINCYRGTPQSFTQ